MYHIRYISAVETEQPFSDYPTTLGIEHQSRMVSGSSLEVSRAKMAGAKRTRASRDSLEYV
jgi:hypothetical protein